MTLPDEDYVSLLGSDETETGKFEPPLVNIGAGDDITIKALAEMIRDAVGFNGEIVFDTSKPDGTPRKLMDVTRLRRIGWSGCTPLDRGIGRAYADFLRVQTAAA
jgi:GDP-L-fucose synthase